MLNQNIILLVLFLLLAGSLYYTEFHDAEKKLEELQKETLLFDCSDEDIKSLHFRIQAGTLGKWEMTLTQRKKDEKWKLESPVDDLADQSTVERILVELSDLRKKRLVEKNPADLSEYGLASPRSIVTFQTKEGKENTLKMGNRSPVGYVTYVQRNSDPAVYLVNAGLENYLTRKVSEIRSKRLFEIDNRSDISDFAVFRGDNELFHLTNDGKKNWKAVRPVQCPLNQAKTDRLIDAFRDLRVDHFVREDHLEMESFGLDTPKLTLVARDVKGREFKVFVGRQAKEKSPEDETIEMTGFYLATNLRKSIYVMAKYQYDKLDQDFSAIRDRKIFPLIETADVEKIDLQIKGEKPFSIEHTGSAWLAKGEKDFPCHKETVENLIDMISEMNARSFLADNTETFGQWKLDDPDFSVRLRLKKQKKPSVFQADFSRLKDKVSVRANKQNSVYGVSLNVAKSIPQIAEDYMETKLFTNIDFTTASLIEIETANNEKIVLGKERFSEERISEWIAILNSVKASRYIQSGRKYLEQWGLDKPLAKVTIETAAPMSEKFQLQIGAITSNKLFYYASSSTRDAIFKLRVRDAKLLLAPFFLHHGTKESSHDGISGTAAYSPSDKEMSGLPMASIETVKGTIKLLLFEDNAPNTVSNFIHLSDTGFYDGTTFHRVENFCIQGGDPNTKDDDPANDGKGGPGYTIADETSSGRSHSRGVLSMAHAGPNTGGSQFFITKLKCPWLDGVHTVFGGVIEGMDIVDTLEKGTKIKSVKITNRRSHDYIPRTHKK